MWTELYRKCHSHYTPGKGIITLESNPSRGTVLPAPHGKGNKGDKNVKTKRTDALSLWHQQLNTTVYIHGPCKPEACITCIKHVLKVRYEAYVKRMNRAPNV